MENNIIISQPWGGLGDNLQFSTLPKIFSEMGFNVYISKNNSYRNPEIYDLVWKLNPYVKGEIDLPPNAGECRGYHMFDKNFIKNIELVHGIQHGNNKYPEIYYKPNIIKELSNTLLYDVTSITQNYSDDYVYNNFKNIFDMYPNIEKKKVIFKNIKNRDSPDFGTDVIVVNNIFEYCDMIASCKVFTCLMSGCSTLASALKRDNEYPKIHCFHHTTPDKFNYIYVFDNIDWHFEKIIN
jgi:hypothetical protein